MSPEKKQKIEKNLKIIAKREGITPEEVKSEIGRAVSYAMKSSDPKAQRFWNNFPCEGDSPTVEEVIAYLAEKLSKSAPHRRTVWGLVDGCDFPRCLFHCTVFYHRKASLSSVRSTKYTAEISPYVLYI